jgi:tol-pal system protein YbgF
MSMRASIVALTLLAAPGCFWVTTKSEGKALRRDVGGLELRVATKEAELGVKVEELQKTLDEAARVLKRNSADLGADVQRIDDEQRKALGLLTAAQTAAEEVRVGFERYKATTEERLAALEERVAALAPRTPAVSADSLWASGKAAFDAKRYAEAREAFRQLAVGFPQHARAAAAQYYRAETHFLQKDWDGAIREYQRVFDKYDKDALAPDALFRAGEAAEQLKNCTEARTYFGLLGQKYPKSNLAKRAAAKDKALRAAANDKKKCTS